MAKRPLKKKEPEIALPGAVGEKRENNPGSWDKTREKKKPTTVLILKQDQAEALREHLMATVPADEPHDSPLRKVLDVMR